ncbi:MAG: hypothetical protein WD176_09785 [Pirellulales bacterium]
MSADGSTIVGSCSAGASTDAFVWDQWHGFRFIIDVLHSQGVEIDPHWKVTHATGVSANGMVVVGYGTNLQGNPEGWRVDLTPPSRPTVGSGEQLRSLSQTGLDQVSVSFSEDVIVKQNDLDVSVAGASELNVTGFAYDPATHTATFRLAQAIEAGAVQITVSSGAGGVRDRAGVPLDGEWENPTARADTTSDTYPSGNGAPGGDFTFHAYILAGDVNGNYAVDLSDVTAIMLRSFAAGGQTRYDFAHDIDANGVINALDVVAARNHQGPVPPAPAPSSPADDSPPPDSVSRRLTARRVDAVFDGRGGTASEGSILTRAVKRSTRARRG